MVCVCFSGALIHSSPVAWTFCWIDHNKWHLNSYTGYSCRSICMEWCGDFELQETSLYAYMSMGIAYTHIHYPDYRMDALWSWWNMLHFILFQRRCCSLPWTRFPQKFGQALRHRDFAFAKNAAAGPSGSWCEALLTRRPCCRMISMADGQRKCGVNVNMPENTVAIRAWECRGSVVRLYQILLL